MAYKALPPQSVLQQLFDYDPDTGVLLWKRRPLETFATVRAGKLWNTIYADKEAFTGLHVTGYQHGRIGGQRYKKHRLVWKLVHGAEPAEIDHINGDRADNRLANLRQVVAVIGSNSKKVHLGIFDSFDDAVAARRAAEIDHGYHPNHGRR